MGRARSRSWDSKRNIPRSSTISLTGLTQSEVKGCPTSGFGAWLGWKSIQTWVGLGWAGGRGRARGLASMREMSDFNQRVM